LKKKDPIMAPKKMASKNPIGKILQGQLSLEAIEFKGGTFERFDLLDEYEFGTEIIVNGDIQFEVRTAVEGTMSFGIFTIRSWGMPKGETDKSRLCYMITGNLRSKYLLSNDELDRAEKVQALTELIPKICLTHVWPYWRQFVFECGQRMGLPPMIVPLLVNAPVPVATNDNSQPTIPLSTKSAKAKGRRK